MYKFFGWLNIILICLMLLPFIIQFFWDKLQGAVYRFSRVLKRPHKIFGIILTLTAFLYGYIASDGFYFNTGTSALLILIVCEMFAIIYSWSKKKVFLKIHRKLVLIFILSVVFHLIYPDVLDWLQLLL